MQIYLFLFEKSWNSRSSGTVDRLNVDLSHAQEVNQIQIHLIDKKNVPIFSEFTIEPF